MSEVPYSREAEEYVLSACIQNPQAIDIAAEYINKDDFYIPSHGQVFDEILAMHLAGEAVDSATLAARGVSGDFIHHLMGLPALVSHTRDYATGIASLALRRRLIRAGQSIIEKAQETTDADEVLDTAESLVYSAKGRDSGDGPVPVRDLLRDATARIEDAKAGNVRRGVTTHINKLNDLIVGLDPGTFTILAGRPSTGKSLLSLDIARHLDGRVLFFSVEMSKSELVDRMLSAEAKVPLTNIRAGKLSDSEYVSLHEAVMELAKSRLRIDDSSTTMMDIMRRTRRAAAEGSLAMVVVDYIQLLSMGKGKQESRQQEVASISRQLKLMAREFNVPVLACSQLNRPDKHYDDDGKTPRPNLSALRESGALEQDADIVLFLHRPHDISPETELIVAKNRNGATGKVLLHLAPTIVTFIAA